MYGFFSEIKPDSYIHDGVVLELYDVVALPGVRRPMAIGFRSDEICRVVTVG
ncbi:MAG: hypothetical protein RMY36_020075 [Nostoc sp. SerVER01]|nr:hypothetical protein [Nostoc sp. SerVER01]MDZ8026112.1 hypothetical protein [Nostoc sp. DedQUE11]MDZ8076318.1 hypothetical protein [Nostoc sp. DedQUE01]MDZ8081393.1 hypothetical protein [Nostoc sp. DcaGUA01]